MFNNTLTLSGRYHVSSSIQFDDLDTTKESRVDFSLDECLSDFGYLYSIELNRTKIKKELSFYFDFVTNSDELDFLASHTQILRILPSIGRFIKNYFDNNSKLELELMSESKSWQTLFINIHTRMDWKKSNTFIDDTLQKLFELYPEVAAILNLNIIPDEF
jgi:hypothetical protein